MNVKQFYIHQAHAEIQDKLVLQAHRFLGVAVTSTDLLQMLWTEGHYKYGNERKKTFTKPAAKAKAALVLFNHLENQSRCACSGFAMHTTVDTELW